MKKQTIKGDLIFVWDEDTKYIEEIKIVNIDQKLMIDFNQQYYAILSEMDICGECKYYNYSICEHPNSMDTCCDRNSYDICDIGEFTKQI